MKGPQWKQVYTAFLCYPWHNNISYVTSLSVFILLNKVKSNQIKSYNVNNVKLLFDQLI